MVAFLLFGQRQMGLHRPYSKFISLIRLITLFEAGVFNAVNRVKPKMHFTITVVHAVVYFVIATESPFYVYLRPSIKNARN